MSEQQGISTVVRLDDHDEVERISVPSENVRVRGEYVTVYLGGTKRIHTPWIRVIEVVEQ